MGTQPGKTGGPLVRLGVTQALDPVGFKKSLRERLGSWAVETYVLSCWNEPPALPFFPIRPRSHTGVINQITGFFFSMSKLHWSELNEPSRTCAGGSRTGRTAAVWEKGRQEQGRARDRRVKRERRGLRAGERLSPVLPGCSCPLMSGVPGLRGKYLKGGNHHPACRTVSYNSTNSRMWCLRKLRLSK